VTTAQRNAVANYRRRLARKGLTRLEVRVHKKDAPLVREVAQALCDPERERETRALLRERFAAKRPKGLKALLAAAPLEDIDLTREQDFGRDVDL
jgi:hypothetical protein